MRKALLSAGLCLALGVSGCGAISQTPTMPSVNPGPPASTDSIRERNADTSTSSSVTTPVDPVQQLQQIEQTWRILGLSSEALLDDAGRPVVLSYISADDVHAQQRELDLALRFRNDSDIQRLIMVTVEERHTHSESPWGSWSSLSKEKVQTWPAPGNGSSGLPPSEWPRRFDLYAERTGQSTWSKAQIQDFFRAWAGQHLGDRLISIDWKEQGNAGAADPVQIRMNAVVTAKPGTLDLQQRLEETAVIGGAIVMANPVGWVQVNYEGAGQGHSIDVWGGALRNWAREGGDRTKLVNWLTVDGRTVDQPEPPTGQASTPPVLDRNRLKQALGKNDKLLVGLRSVDIEATVPPDRPWVQVWSNYDQELDRLFASSPSVLGVDLIVRHGAEIEYVSYDRDYWQVHRGLAAIAGHLDPATFPLMALWYDRFTVVNP